MRILVSIKNMEDAAGGAERVISQLLPALVARGHEIHLVTLDRPSAESFYSLPQAVSWTKLGTAGNGAKLTPLRFLRSVAALRRAARGIAPDVAVGIMHSLYVPLAAALLGTRIPLVASEHIVAEHYRKRPMEYLLLCLASLRARYVTVLSQAIALQFPAIVRARAIPIPNPVPVPPAAASGNAPARDGQAPRVLTMGRLYPQKDHPTLIRAVAQLLPEFPDMRLRIVGEGPMRADLEQLVQDLGVGACVDLPGRVRDTEREYANADLFVMPSLYESFGLVVAEALAHRVPVVAFRDCPGLREILTHDRDSVLVDPADRVTALAGGIRDLLSDRARARRLGAQGPVSVARFAPETVFDSWEAMLADAAGHGRRATPHPRP